VGSERKRRLMAVTGSTGRGSPASPGGIVALARARRFGSAVLLRIAAPVVLIVLWELAAGSANSLWFPPPSNIVTRMYELWFSAGFPVIFTPAVAEDILPSVGRMLAGWGLAGVIGVALGLAIGRSQVISQTVEPTVHFLRSTPGPALVPIFLILLGTDSAMRISLIAFASMWPILLNTIDGVRAVDPTQLETARVFGMPRWSRLVRIVLPSAMPKIFAGLTIALAVSLTLMVISELTVATDGIGYQIQRASQLFAITDMWAGIMLIAVLGVLLNVLLNLVERRVLRWYRGARRHND
jgi:ABC-type nitrate/sulfonate/bicarbonate transport system permease component